MTMSRPVHFVLDGLEETFCHFRTRVVIHTGLINIANLPVKIPLGKPDFPDALQKFIKIIAASAFFQSLVVQRKAFDNIFPQPLGRPNSKLRASVRFYAVANSDYGFQIIIINPVGFSVGGSCCKICNN